MKVVMKLVKWFICISASLLSVLGNICSICSGKDSTTSHIVELWNELGLTNLLPYLNILVVMVVLYLLVYWICYKLGVRKVRCSVTCLICYILNSFKNNSEYYIHQLLYHKKYSLLKALKHKEVTKYEDIVLQNAIEEYLRLCNDIIYRLIGADCSVNVKLINSKLEDGCFEATTYKRYTSETEKKNCESPRLSEGKFIIKFHEMVNWEKSVNSVNCDIDNDRNNKKYIRNSAYDYVISSNVRYWMSNNLQLDLKQNKFVCSNDNWATFYNSIAVFTIAPPTDNKPEEECQNIIGLLIFDSLKSHAFTNRKCKLMMGLMAHMLYELFNVIEQNREKKNGKNENGKETHN